ncbi:MAG: LEPR-XLL domain-containing protein [Burkholderiales bacterium]|nr:LEPR-XLL domain-containing protein [Burkholderiales bacterium]
MVLFEQLERRLLLAAALSLEVIEKGVQAGFERALGRGVETGRLLDEPCEHPFRRQG